MMGNNAQCFSISQQQQQVIWYPSPEPPGLDKNDPVSLHTPFSYFKESPRYHLVYIV